MSEAENVWYLTGYAEDEDADGKLKFWRATRRFDGPYEEKVVPASELEAAQKQVKELETIISHLPKVPTQPYEKELAKRLQSAEDMCERLAKSAGYIKAESANVCKGFKQTTAWKMMNDELSAYELWKKERVK